MNKTLTPLAALEDIILYLNANEPKGLYCKNIEIIKAALKEKDEAFHEVVKIYQELIASFTKELKAFEIIKNHIISREHYTSGIYFEKDGDYYEIKLRNGADCFFTEEEYELLKEVLNEN